MQEALNKSSLISCRKISAVPAVWEALGRYPWSPSADGSLHSGQGISVNFRVPSSKCEVESRLVMQRPWRAAAFSLPPPPFCPDACSEALFGVYGGSPYIRGRCEVMSPTASGAGVQAGSWCTCFCGWGRVFYLSMLAPLWFNFTREINSQKQLQLS